MTVSADLVDNGSSPWRVVRSADGAVLYGSSKQSKAIAWGTNYAVQHPAERIEFFYAGGRWDVSGSTTEPEPAPDPAPDPEPTPEPEPDPTPVPPPPPPSTGTAHFVGDFSGVQSDAELQNMPGLTVVTTGNVHAEPGVGMRYDFQPFPTRCGDQELTSHVALPAGTKRFWLKWRARYSANWTTVNPNCASPTPDYKWILAMLSGGGRYDFKAGTGPNGWWGTFAIAERLNGIDAPLSAQQPGRGSPNPLPMPQLWDGQWHDVALEYGILPNDRALVRARVDAVEIANYTTGGSLLAGLSSKSFTKLKLGANRNLGATELMHVWWDDVRAWSDVTGAPDASEFAPFGATTDY